MIVIDIIIFIVFLFGMWKIIELIYTYLPQIQKKTNKKEIKKEIINEPVEKAPAQTTELANEDLI